MDPYDAPHDLRCPITYALFRDPVFNSHGNTYERDAIRTAFAKQPSGPKRDPLTNSELPDARLVPDQRARRAVTAWLEEHAGGAGLPLPPLAFEQPSRRSMVEVSATVRWADRHAEIDHILPEDFAPPGDEDEMVPWSQTEEGAEAVRRLAADDPTLTELVLFDHGVCDACAFALAEALRTNTHLERLYIGDEFVEDAGVAAIAGALWRSPLRRLELCIGSLTIGEEGVLALAEMLLHNIELRLLDISGNGSWHQMDVLVAAASDRAAGRGASLQLLSDDVRESFVGGDDAAGLVDASLQEL